MDRRPPPDVGPGGWRSRIDGREPARRVGNGHGANAVRLLAEPSPVATPSSGGGRPRRHRHALDVLGVRPLSRQGEGQPSR